MRRAITRVLETYYEDPVRHAEQLVAAAARLALTSSRFGEPYGRALIEAFCRVARLVIGRYVDCAAVTREEDGAVAGFDAWRLVDACVDAMRALAQACKSANDPSSEPCAAARRAAHRLGYPSMDPARWEENARRGCIRLVADVIHGVLLDYETGEEAAERVTEP